MLIQEQLAKDRLKSKLAEAQEMRLSIRAAAMHRARRRARRARARMHRAERVAVQLRSSLHTGP